MNLKADIHIQGAGTVGKTLALLLARERLRVVVQRGAPAGSAQTDIRSYALNAAAQHVLTSLKVWPEAAACPVVAMRIATHSGAQLAFDGSAEQPLAHIVDAAALDAELEQAMAYQSGIQSLSAEQALAPQAPLLAICEGRDSSSRAALPIEYESHAYGQTAIAAHLHCDTAHGNTAYQWFDATGNVLALLPRLADAGHSVALVWSVDTARAQALMALPEDAFVAALQTACHNTLGAMRITGARAAWPLRIAQAAQWCGSLPGHDSATAQNARSWVLLGDAAHAMHPLAGQGLNVGLGDAQALARILSQRPYFRSVADLRLLRSYERERRAHWQTMRMATDGIQRLFTHEHATVQSMAHWGVQLFNRLPLLKHMAMHTAMG